MAMSSTLPAVGGDDVHGSEGGVVHEGDVHRVTPVESTTITADAQASAAVSQPGVISLQSRGTESVAVIG